MSPKTKVKHSDKPAGKPDQKSKPKPSNKKAGPHSSAAHNGKSKFLPLILEAGFSLSGLVTLFVSMAVIIISYFSGATILNILLRTGVAILGMGVLSWVVTYRLVNNWVENQAAEQAAQAETLMSTDSTIELKA